MNPSILREFRKLSTEAEERKYGGCCDRAWSLSDTIRGIDDSRVDFVVRFYPTAPQSRLKPRRLLGRGMLGFDVEWHEHFAVKWNGLILDPSLGAIVHEEDYLQMFTQPDEIKCNPRY